MKRATATPTGTATTIAMVDAVTVVHRNSRMPKAGWSPPGAQTRLVKKFAVLSSNAGTACTMRKTAMRVTRAMTRTPDTVAAPPKSRSPMRPVEAWSPCSGLCPSGPGVWSAADTPVTVDTWRPLPSVAWYWRRGGRREWRPPLRCRPGLIAPTESWGASGDRVDRGLDLGRDLGRQRGVALGLEALLDLVRGEGLEEALDLLARRGVGVLRAHDLVRHEDDRVGPGLLGGVVDLEREVVARAGLLGRGDRLARRGGGQLDRAGAGVDLGHRELVLLGVGELDVRDAAVLPLRGGGDTGRLLLVDALAVVGDRDGARDHGQVPGVGAAGGLGVLGLDLAVLGRGLERGVGPGEVDLLGDELLDAGAGARGLVVDVGVGALRLVRLDRLVDGVLLGRGALGLEIAGEAVAGGRRARRGGARAGRGAVVLGRAGRERESAGQGDGAERADTRNRHECDPSRWGVPGGRSIRSERRCWMVIYGEHRCAG